MTPPINGVSYRRVSQLAASKRTSIATALTSGCSHKPPLVVELEGRGGPRNLDREKARRDRIFAEDTRKPLPTRTKRASAV